MFTVAGKISLAGLNSHGVAICCNTLAQLDIERRWVADDRPYYDLYPSVAEAFLKVDLNKITCGMLRLPIPTDA